MHEPRQQKDTLWLTPKSVYNRCSLKRQPNYRGQIGFRLEALRPRLSTGLPLSRCWYLIRWWLIPPKRRMPPCFPLLPPGLEALISTIVLRLWFLCDRSVMLPLAPLLRLIAW